MCHPLVSRSRDSSMVLHRCSRCIVELDKPSFDDRGQALGWYEPWQIEVVDEPTLPTTPDLSLLAGGQALLADDGAAFEVDHAADDGGGFEN